MQEGERIILEKNLPKVRGRMLPVRSQVEKRLRVPKNRDNLDKLQYLEGIKVEEINRGAMEGTKIAHFDGGIPCLETHFP